MAFSNTWKWKVKGKSLSRVRLFPTPWTAAYQAPPPMGFSRQEYWSGLPLPSPEGKLWQTYKPRQHIKKQKHHFADKGPYSQSCGFSSSRVRMWELDYIESWVPKNWCFWTVVLEKILKSPLDCNEVQPVCPKIQSVLPKGDLSWIFFGKTDALAEAPILWPPYRKSQLTGKDWC